MRVIKENGDFRVKAIAGTHTVLIALDCKDKASKDLAGFAMKREVSGAVEVPRRLSVEPAAENAVATLGLLVTICSTWCITPFVVASEVPTGILIVMLKSPLSVAGISSVPICDARRKLAAEIASAPPRTQKRCRIAHWRPLR